MSFRTLTCNPFILFRSTPRAQTVSIHTKYTVNTFGDSVSSKDFGQIKIKNFEIDLKPNNGPSKTKLIISPISESTGRPICAFGQMDPAESAVRAIMDQTINKFSHSSTTHEIGHGDRQTSRVCCELILNESCPNKMDRPRRGYLFKKKKKSNYVHRVL